MRLALGLLLAGASTVAFTWGDLAQHGAVGALPRLSVRSPLRSLRVLVGNLRWVAGFLGTAGGWGFYVAALALAPLSLVQAITAGGIGLLAFLISRTTAVRLTRTEWIGVGLAVGGLAVLGLSLVGGAGHSTRGSWVAICAWIVVSAVAAAAAAGPAAVLLAPGAGLAIASATFFAAGDVGTKAAVFGGARFAFIPVFLAAYALGFVAQQLSYQRGSALATVGLGGLLTSALPIVAGLALFGEPVPGGFAGILRIAGFLAVVVAAGLVAGPAAPAPIPTPAPPAPR